ncbi:MAG TPA: cytochrome c [Afifellaceae bacterium]|nr:cytochrome c [Afifellaceae bacterium]
MIKYVSLGLVLAVGCVSATASAAEDPIVTRKAIMQSVGAAAGAGGGMLKGEIPFNPAVATLSLRTMRAAAHSYGSFFPEGSDTGMETTASPKIWEDMAGFSEKLAKFQADADAAVEAKPADLESFKTAFGSVAQNCKGCHEAYRVKKN